MIKINDKIYAWYSSPIGLLELVSQNNKLIYCSFTDKEKESKFNPILKETIRQLDEYFLHTRKTFDLDIMLIGTDFQKKIWNFLLSIPYGETISYKNIANKLEIPHAARAIGNANGKNPISIIIPCHRVIGSDNSLKGYGGGIERKKWLLNFEKNSYKS